MLATPTLKKSIKKLFNRMGENIYDLFYLQEADIKATNHQDFLENIENGRRILKEILEKKEPLSLKDLKINGNDLKKLGYKEGREIGLTLEKLFNLIIEDKTKNDYNFLMNVAKTMKKSEEEWENILEQMVLGASW